MGASFTGLSCLLTYGFEKKVYFRGIAPEIIQRASNQTNYLIIYKRHLLPDLENNTESLDVQLILRLQAGDETAFREVFDRFNQKIYGLACHFLKNKEQGKEVVQETMLRFWEHRLKLSTDYALAPYVYTIARRVTLNMLRQAASSRAASMKLWQSVPAYHNDTEEAILGADLERVTVQILNILPPRQQEIFRLSRFEGLSYEEIAVRMNISTHTVKYHMMAALKVLRTHFNEAEIVFGFLAFSLLF